jgi:hypothetical protein
VAFVDAGAEPAELDGVIYVAIGDGGPKPERLAELTQSLRPAKVQVVRKLADLPGAIERVRAERPIVAAARAAAAVRRCIARVSEEGARAEAICEKRIAALESQRIPDPVEFRSRQLQRMVKAIDDGARDVKATALEHWRSTIARIRQEWRVGVEACADRKEVERFVRTINETAPARLHALVDDVGQHAVREMQRASETMQIWLLEEVHARYHVTRRIEEGYEPAAVIGEAIELAPLARGPLESALDRFETRRVGLGLGGVAAGAVLGTLIVPGIGTAVGAFLGAFAGLFKGLDSLKQECIARLDACLEEVETSLVAQITSREPSFANALRSSLDEALEQAMQRLDASITHLMTLERRLLATERKKRDDLAKLRAGLEEDVARVAAPANARTVP